MITTPPSIAKWIFEVTAPYHPTIKSVIDPAVGKGNLIAPFHEFLTVGVDIDNHAPTIKKFIHENFLGWPNDRFNADLVLIHPPFTHTPETRSVYGRRSNITEIYLEKCFKLFGSEVKMVALVPNFFLMNCRSRKGTSPRYRKLRDEWPQITSIVSVPLDICKNPVFDETKKEAKKDARRGNPEGNISRVEIMQQILFFNMPGLSPHYLLPQEVLNNL